MNYNYDYKPTPYKKPIYRKVDETSFSSSFGTPMCYQYDKIRNDDEEISQKMPKNKKTNEIPFSSSFKTPIYSINDNKETRKKQNKSKSVAIKDKTHNFNEKNVNIKMYEKKYNEKDFWNKIKKYAIKIGSKPIYIALLLFYSLPRASIYDKAIIIGALGFLISPLDLIFDCIPVVGFLDDIGILLFVFSRIKANIDDEAKAKAKNKFKSIFDEYTDKQIDELID